MYKRVVVQLVQGFPIFMIKISQNKNYKQTKRQSCNQEKENKGKSKTPREEEKRKKREDQIERSSHIS